MQQPRRHELHHALHGLYTKAIHLHAVLLIFLFASVFYLFTLDVLRYTDNNIWQEVNGT